MVLMAYRHGLRMSELINLTWRQIDLDAARLRVIRANRSEYGLHRLSGREIRALRSLRRRQVVGTPRVFITSRGGPLTRNGFFKLLAKAAALAGITYVHPHLLRHACGFKLVNQGMDTLSLGPTSGTQTCRNTKRYARMDAARSTGYGTIERTPWSSRRCHTATYGVPLSKAYEMDCQRRSSGPTWVMLQSLNKRQAPCPKLPTSRA